MAIALDYERGPEDVLLSLSDTSVAVHATVVEYRHGLSFLCARLAAATESAQTTTALVRQIEDTVGNDLFGYLNDAEQAVHAANRYDDGYGRFGSRASSPERTGVDSVKRHLECTAATVHLANAGLQRLLGMRVLGRLADAVDALQEVGVEVRRVAGSCAVPLVAQMMPSKANSVEIVDNATPPESPLSSVSQRTHSVARSPPNSPVKGGRGKLGGGQAQKLLTQSRELVRIALRTKARDLVRFTLRFWREEQKKAKRERELAEEELWESVPPSPCWPVELPSPPMPMPELAPINPPPLPFRVPPVPRGPRRTQILLDIIRRLEMENERCLKRCAIVAWCSLARVLRSSLRSLLANWTQRLCNLMVLSMQIWSTVTRELQWRRDIRADEVAQTRQHSRTRNLCFLHAIFERLHECSLLENVRNCFRSWASSGRRRMANLRYVESLFRRNLDLNNSFCFQEWLSCVRQKQGSKFRQQVKARAETLLRQMLSKWVLWDQCLLSSIIQVWINSAVIAQIQNELGRVRGHLLKEKEQAVLRRMFTVLGMQLDHLASMILLLWYEDIKRDRAERLAQIHIAEMREENKQGVVRQMMLKLGLSTDHFLGVLMQSWREDVRTEKAERIAQARIRDFQDEKKQVVLRGIISKLGLHVQQFVYVLMQAWFDFVRAEKTERAAQVRIKALQDERSQATLRLTMTRIGMNNDNLLALALSVWNGECKGEKAMREAAEKMAFLMKSELNEERVRQTLARIGLADSQMLTLTIQSWCQHVAAETALATFKAKQDEKLTAVLHSVAAKLNLQIESFAIVALHAWYDHVESEKGERDAQAKILDFQDEQKQFVLRQVMANFAVSDEHLVGLTVYAWREGAKLQVMEQKVLLQLRDMKEKKKDGLLMQLFAKLALEMQHFVGFGIRVWHEFTVLAVTRRLQRTKRREKLEIVIRNGELYEMMFRLRLIVHSWSLFKLVEAERSIGRAVAERDQKRKLKEAKAARCLAVNNYAVTVRRHLTEIYAFTAFVLWHDIRLRAEREQVQERFDLLKAQLSGTLNHEAALQNRLTGLMVHVEKLRTLANRTGTKELLRDRATNIFEKVDRYLHCVRAHDVLVVWKAIACVFASSPRDKTPTQAPAEVPPTPRFGYRYSTDSDSF
eukprot:TRINITY_DN13286_c0_g1_i1.p1 TRINITY_DN13286_c0_g1~~TRINITY_DN13286_c0_g1_i1.p1  ORF type:complete len:1142 (-),score=162.81 TRINITY_DN13286_c0_g1_i1:241-3666(-)